jgi:tetratricopeptide (TPR) repeat protein
MSKRSTRRKRRDRQKRQEARLDAATLIQQGKQAFQQSDYGQSIKLWEKAQTKPEASSELPRALAEAYFRRSLSDPSPRPADLQQAVKLNPTEPRYRYHLALAHHRQGELKQAESLYRQLLAESPPFSRAAGPLAQLLLERGQRATQDPVWAQLPAQTQAQLAVAEALLQKKGGAALPPLAEQPLDPLWQGLLALASNDPAAASQLQAALEAGDLHPLPRSLAHYYLGVAAVRANQPEAALAHWQKAQADGLDTPHLRHNLSTLAFEQAVWMQQRGRPQQAAELLAQVNPNGQADRRLQALQQQLNLELGYAAAQKGNWTQAVGHWETAERAGDDSRSLVYNLALAYQHVERFQDAADYWRTLLRRRPRRSSHPEALTEQQVARIWQNVAENYAKAGDFEEAITTYKNAVKWAPDNLDLRLQLVEAYQVEGRWQAAENELNRILEKEPDNIRALTLLAESYSDSYYPGQARRLWLRILELEPQNPVARQQLAHTIEREGFARNMWGQPHQAIEIYQEGLKHVPDSQRLLVKIGGTYAQLGNFEQARVYLNQAHQLNPNDLQTLHTIFNIWLEFNSKPDLQQAFDLIKAVKSSIPGGFFLDLVQRCLKLRKEPEARRLLEYADTQYAADDDVSVSIAMAYLDLADAQQARSILRRVLKHNPAHIEANIELGILYYEMDQTRLAKRHWQEAETEARKLNDLILVHRIKLIKDEFLHGKLPPRNPIEMIKSLPPQLREQILQTAPPEVAELLRDPQLLDLMMNFPGVNNDDFDDEDGFF